MPTYTKDEILEMGEIDPEFAQFLREHKFPPPNYDDLVAFKRFAEQRSKQRELFASDVSDSIKVSEHHYITRDHTKMRVKIFQPILPPTRGSPLIVLFHGGGFCVGSLEGEEETARNLTQAFHATCISCSYRLAPEFPFPYAPQDCWAALRWAARNATSLGADPSVGFIVGGTSAGANMSAILAHLARDNNLSPPLTGQYLAAPTVLSYERIPERYKDKIWSYEQNRVAPVLPLAAINMFLNGYKPDLDDGEYCILYQAMSFLFFSTVPSNILYVTDAVLNHPKGHFNLPPAFLQVDGMDPFRDEGLLYADVLSEEHGVKTRINIYPGLPHAHWNFFPSLKSSTKFRKEQIEGFGWLLGQESKAVSALAK